MSMAAWVEKKIADLKDQIRVIENGDVRYWSTHNGEEAVDVTDQRQKDNIENLANFEALLAEIRQK